MASVPSLPPPPVAGQTVVITHPPSGQEWRVPFGALIAASVVFEKMFADEAFLESQGDTKSLEMADFEADDIARFLALVEYPSNRPPSFGDLAHGLDATKVVGLIEKYDAKGVLHLVVDLVIEAPNLPNVVAVDRLLGDDFMWPEHVMKFVVDMTVGWGKECQRPKVDRDALSRLRLGTAIQMMEHMNAFWRLAFWRCISRLRNEA